MRNCAETLIVTEGADGSPADFVWRGRRYRITQVLQSWRECLPWWRLAVEAASVEADEGAMEGGAVPPARRLLGHLGEQRVWRVEAAAGRMSSCGVFEVAQCGDEWLLRRMSD